MIKYKNLNNISDELLKDIPKLEPNQEVCFQMLNGHKNNDYDLNERSKEPMLYGKTQLSTKFRIRDPYTKNTVDVGIPMAIENDTVTSFRPFLAGNFDGKFNGKFSLFGGNIQDEEFFEAFWLSPEREGSPCEDARIKPLFKILSHKEESNKVMNQVEILRKALADLEKLEEKDYREFASAQNYSDTDLDAIKAKVNEFGKKHPDLYLKIRQNPETEIRANLRRALDKGIINYNSVNGETTYNGNLLLVVAKDNKPDFLGAIASWTKSARNGQEVYDGILKQL